MFRLNHINNKGAGVDSPISEAGGTVQTIRSRIGSSAYSQTEKGAFRDEITGEVISWDTITNRFNQLSTISSATSNEIAERVSATDVQALLEEFKKGNYDMQFLFQYILNRNRMTTSWIDHQKNPRVLAVLEQGINEVHYYSIPQAKRLESNYGVELKETDTDPNKTRLEVADTYDIPELEHVGTQLLPYLEKMPLPDVKMDRKRLVIILANAILNLLDGKSIYMNRSLFEAVAKLGGDKRQVNSNPTDLFITGINALLRRTPYQISRTMRAAA